MAVRINPSALSPVRAVVAELVVAHWLNEEGEDLVVFGGRRGWLRHRSRRAPDRRESPRARHAQRAAQVSRMEPEAATRWMEAFDPSRTTDLMLVVFPETWSAETSVSMTRTTFSVLHEGIRLHRLPVHDMNQWLAEGPDRGDVNKLAYVVLSDEWLNEYRVV